MTRKSILALTAVLALGSTPLATSAYAAPHGSGHFGGGGGHAGGGHFGGGGGHFGGFGGGHFGGGRLGGAHFGGHFPAGVRGHAFAPGGHHRHFWHGRWWNYGIGPCWVWSDLYGEYVWQCD